MKLRTQQNNLNNVRIQDSCLLVKVTVKKFGNSRQDKEASLKAADDHNASTDVVKVNKKLLNSPVISALSKVQGQITNGPVSVFTLPWEEKSWRLIERNVIQKFEGKLKEHFDKFIGNVIKVKLKTKIDNRKIYKGKLLGRNDDIINIVDNNQKINIKIDAIEICRLVPAFK